MEWSILFMGPVGAGKTSAVKTLSTIDMAGTDVAATDSAALLKRSTTVSLDSGVLNLGMGDKVRLLGAPGQDRFDFMWEILLDQANAVVILIDHSRDCRLSDLSSCILTVERKVGRERVPLAIGITHVDKSNDSSLDCYFELLSTTSPTFYPEPPPIFRVDARNICDMRTLVISTGAMLEMETRFASRF